MVTSAYVTASAPTQTAVAGDAAAKGVRGVPALAAIPLAVAIRARVAISYGNPITDASAPVRGVNI